ncbi:hypothetical protein SAMN05444166_7837 [Singulisphaera sp. GP187]|uniref:hypothetical protein n=1 Tax=Singulisphaera sp. GP187 TaxID=1882752 RepID=UPI000927A7A0|nr:hypothetical protein [Singulisphaera sp. GP187]SIO65792.1 hypothetical protein SAMN05444166_7837 [Singulisphaera sp. GP187]
MATDRKFTILDATALLSATAFAAVPVGWMLTPLARRLEGYKGNFRWELAYLDSLLRYALGDRALGRAMMNGLPPAAMTFLFAYAFILLALRLLSPRPPTAELVRQPGLWASGGVVLGTASMLTLRSYQPVILPASVALAWLGLALSGQWRAERSWIDRCGRIVGTCWLVLLPPCAYFAWTG